MCYAYTVSLTCKTTLSHAKMSIKICCFFLFVRISVWFFLATMCFSLFLSNSIRLEIFNMTGCIKHTDMPTAVQYFTYWTNFTNFMQFIRLKPTHLSVDRAHLVFSISWAKQQYYCDAHWFLNWRFIWSSSVSTGSCFVFRQSSHRFLTVHFTWSPELCNLILTLSSKCFFCCD